MIMAWSLRRTGIEKTDVRAYGKQQSCTVKVTPHIWAVLALVNGKSMK